MLIAFTFYLQRQSDVVGICNSKMHGPILSVGFAPVIISLSEMQCRPCKLSSAMRDSEIPPHRLAAGGLSFHNRTNRRYIIIIID